MDWLLLSAMVGFAFVIAWNFLVGMNGRLPYMGPVLSTVAYFGIFGFAFGTVIVLAIKRSGTHRLLAAMLGAIYCVHLMLVIIDLAWRLW